MKHIEKMEIHNFKGIKNLKINDMKTINIFIGDNNSGKTSILESISMFEKPFDYVSHLNLLSRKYNQVSIKYDNIKQIFNNSDYNNKIEINLDINDNIKANLNIDGKEEEIFYLQEENINIEEQLIDRTVLTYGFNNDIKEFHIDNIPKREIKITKEKINFLNLGYVTPIDTYMEKSTLSAIDTVIRSGKKQKLINLLQIFDKNIIDLNYISNKELYITTKNRGTLSISNFGDGLKKAVVLIAKAIDAKDGVLLIDEIETSIHKDILGKIFKELIKNTKQYHTQVVATTHSLEAIKELLSNLESDLDSITLYRLEEFKGQIYARRFSGKKAFEIIIKEGGDLR